MKIKTKQMNMFTKTLFLFENKLCINEMQALFCME